MEHGCIRGAGDRSGNRERVGRRISRIVAAVGLAAGLLALAGPPHGPAGAGSGRPRQVEPIDDLVHLNEIQVVGSHNSYHLVPPQAEVDLRTSFIGAGDLLMQYQHAPLPVQFTEQKVRQIELDVFVDRAGGRYATPLLRVATGGPALDPVMSQPGLKVFHIQDVDYASTCLTLRECLRAVKGWSDANPSHVPLAILLELKDSPLVVGSIPFVVPEPWDGAAMDELDADIRSVFGPEQIIEPDDVRGSHATLEAAVLADGWPTLGESRGQVMFLMDNGGGYRDRYLAGHPSLAGRILFTNSRPGQDDAAFVKMNEATEGDAIRELVAAGYVVRTRADADTTQARNNDTTLRDLALASGAQWVSTDYPAPGVAFGFVTDYVVEIPGGTVARCNPVNAPPGCRDDLLEDLAVPPVPPDPPVAPTDPLPGPSIDPPPDPGGPVGEARGAVALPGRANYTG